MYYQVRVCNLVVEGPERGRLLCSSRGGVGPAKCRVPTWGRHFIKVNKAIIVAIARYRHGRHLAQWLIQNV